jgi:hypothetical protein
MELNKQLQAEIAEIFKGVRYGRISFFLSPEKKTLDYSVEITGKLSLSKVEKLITPRPVDKKHACFP